MSAAEEKQLVPSPQYIESAECNPASPVIFADLIGLLYLVGMFEGNSLVRWFIGVCVSKWSVSFE